MPDDKDYLNIETDIKNCIEKAKQLGFDIFIATKTSPKILYVSFSEEHGSISIASGEHPGSWTVK
jgi:hypothetical protein